MLVIVTAELGIDDMLLLALSQVSLMLKAENGSPSTQGRPAGDEEPGVGPVLRRRAGEPEAEPAEVAVGDGRPLGVWA